MSTQRSEAGVSRRTVIAGAAWAVPAIAVVSNAPAFAASPIVEPELIPGTLCKYPGGSAGNDLKHAYRFRANFTNKSTHTVNVEPLPGASSITFDGDAARVGRLRFFESDPLTGGELGSFTLEGGETKPFYLVLDNYGNSQDASGTITIAFKVTDNVTGESMTQVFTVRFPKGIIGCDKL